MSAASDLTEASWQAFSRLLDEALEQPPGERLTWLDALGPEHASLKPALRAVLEKSAQIETRQWLATLPRDATPPPADEPDLRPDALVGPYRLIRELGVGGMGAVWLAERADGTLKRQVALKLPRASWSRGLAERMARERDILAALEHPNIARLYDAGTDTQGRPYLALEYVEGQPIDVYCRERKLPIRERVGLLLQVARAVAFAHSRLVVHRDLKPSNILVTADGQVRLLDFGIAKLMEGDRAAETQLTQLAGRALTPDYASPEQIRGEPIGTASDVYSLGVVAFELLAGARPYKLKRGSAAEVEEAVLAADMPLASSVAPDTVTRRALRGDLDAILSQALRKDVKRRYATVEALADDLGRHLEGLPVAARPDSRAYRLRKFVARNRLAVGAAAATMLALGIGAIVATWQAQVARREAQTAEQVQRFILGVFSANSGLEKDPQKARSTTARELLDNGARNVDESLKDAPQARARMYRMLGSMYVELDLYEQAIALDEKRVALLRETRADNAQIAEALLDLVNSLQSTARRVEIGPHLEEARRLLDDAGDRQSELRGQLMVRLARYNFNHSLTAAARYADEAVAIWNRYPTRLQWQSTSYVVGARARAGLGEYRLAAEAYQRSLDILLRMEEDRRPHQDLSTTRYSLAEMRFIQQRFGDALALARESAEGAVAAFGARAPATIIAVSRLALLRHALGDREAARRAMSDALTDIVQVKGEDDALFTPTVRTMAARAYLNEGRLAAAADLAARVARVNRKSYPGSMLLTNVLRLQAAVAAAQGRLDGASALLDESEAIGSKGADSEARPWRLNDLHLLRARIALARQQPADALQALARVAELPEDESPSPTPQHVEWRSLKALAHLAAGDMAAATREATQAARDADTVASRGTLPSMQADAALALGTVLLHVGREADAAPWIDKALALRRRFDVEDSPNLARVLAVHGLCAARRGDRASARASLTEAERITAGRDLGPWITGPIEDLRRALTTRR